MRNCTSPFLLLLALCVPVAASSAQALSKAAAVHVNSVSSALTALRASPSSRSANAAASRAFERLIKDHSAASDEALAALAGHYLGESTEPECEILSRGERMLPWLRRFKTNPPLIRLPTSTAHSRGELIAQIQSGAICE
jgi:hypothetical protein